MKGYIKQKEGTQETTQRKVPTLSGEEKKKKDYSNDHPDIYFYTNENRTRTITGYFGDLNTNRK